MKIITRTLLMLFIIVTSANCQKEQSFDEEPIQTNTPKNPITANLQGIVLDENGSPSAGALVVVGSKTATTTANGFFRILNADLDKSASMVKVEKAGYFVGYRTFMATAGSNMVKIKLVKKQLVGTVNATSGGVATLANGATVTLQANGIVKKAGGAYSSDVLVYAAYIDPTATDIAETIPGSFMADDKDNKRVLLKSFGMLAVELESASGEKLQIAPGKAAALKTPIPATLLATSPSTIPLWYVDEQTGIWKEQGSASKEGNFYVGNVTHFSFWNCDVSIPAVILTFRLVTSTGLPIMHAYASVLSQNNGDRCGRTNNDGIISGLVPANQNLTLFLNADCSGTNLSSQNLGSFSQNTNLGNIINTSTIPIVEISGNLVNCSGQPITNGEALIYGYNWPTYVTANSTGNFNYAYLKCTSSPINVDIIGIDNTTLQQSNTNSYSINSTNINLGTIVACGTPSSQFINYTLDGTNYSITNLVDSSKGVTYGVGSGMNTTLTFMDVISSKNISLGFNSNVQAPGMFNINFLITQNTYRSPLNGSTINITNFPLSVGGFYEGNFISSYNDALTPTIVHNVNGNFRIRRIN